MKQPIIGESRAHLTHASILTATLPVDRIDSLQRYVEPAFVEAMQLRGSERVLETLDGGVALDSDVFPTSTYAGLLDTPMARAQIRAEYGVEGSDEKLLNAAINLYSPADISKHIAISRAVFGNYDYELYDTAEDAVPTSFGLQPRQASPGVLPITKETTENLLDELLNQVGFDELDRLCVPDVGSKVAILAAKSRRHQESLQAQYRWEDAEHGQTNIRILRLVHSAGAASLHELSLSLQTERQLTETEKLRTSLGIKMGENVKTPVIHLLAGIISTDQTSDFSPRNRVFDDLIRGYRSSVKLRKRLGDIAGFLATPSSESRDIFDGGHEQPQLHA